jgi:hypothetical protein
MSTSLGQEEIADAVQLILREDSVRSLFLAVDRGMDKVVDRILLSGNVSANDRNPDGAAPLHVAAINGYPSTCRVLHAFGADVNALWDGSTPMHLAASESHSEVVSVLVALGASLEIRDSLGFTSLHIVAIRGNRSLAMYLIQAGADPMLKDGDGKTVAERWNFASQLPSVHHEEQQITPPQDNSPSRVPEIHYAISEPALMKVFRGFETFVEIKRVEPITPHHYEMKRYYWIQLSDLVHYLNTHVDGCGIPPSAVAKKVEKLLESARKHAQERGDANVSFEDFSILWLKAQTVGLL